MKPIKLSLRLQAIYDLVPYSVIADVGADHGKLIMSLYEDKKISHGYAIENKKGPYERLVSSIKERGLIDNVIPLFSDGIKDIPNSVTTLILAGMGGNTILDILVKGHEKLPNINTIIVDAHSSTPIIRKKLSDFGFVIADEKLIKEDDIYYEIIKFIRSDVANYSEQELEFGPILSKQKSELFKEKYNERIKEIDEILKKNIPESKSNELHKEKERINVILL